MSVLWQLIKIIHHLQNFEVSSYSSILNFFKNKFYLFIYFWLHWVFIAARRLSLVAASGGYSCGTRASHCSGFFCCERGMRASHCGGFFCCGAQALGAWASVVVACGLSSCGSWGLECRLSSCGTWD